MSRRVVHIGDCQLILGDCREVLESLPKADAIVTDPPYGLGDRMQGGTWGAANKYVDMRGWDGDAPNEVHHLTYRNIGNEFLWELAAVCSSCHDRLHPEKRGVT